MPKLSFRPFAGERPRLNPTELPAPFAQKATNCYLKRGVISPSRSPSSLGVTVPALSKSIYLYNREGNSGNGFWFSWDDDQVDVVQSPIPDDQFGRVYFTGNGIPRFTAADVATAGGGPYPTASFELGLPTPDALVASGPSSEVPDDAQVIECTYVITFVDDYGHEGPPSFASNIVSRWDGETVELTSIPVLAGNNAGSTKRIYREELQSGVYQLVAEIPNAATTHSDAATSAEMGTAMVSESWLAPNPNMIGLTPLPRGVLMGWWDNTLAFSEPNQPHAWPLEYRISFDDKVVGAGLTDRGILVATEGTPYLVIGTNPDAMQKTAIDAYQACVSAGSLVDVGQNVMYASEEGIIGLGGNLTADHMTSEQWRELNPESIHAYRWRDRYLAFYDNGEQGCFTFHPSEGFIFYSDYFDSAYQDKKTGDVYLIDSGSLLEWFGGADRAAIWRSRPVESPFLNSPGVAKVEAENYPVTFRYFGDGQSVKTVQVNNRRAFKLPNRRNINQWEFEIETLNTVTAVHIAMEMSEL